MFDHSDTGPWKVPHQTPRTGGISEVVVRNLLALELPRAGETGRRFRPGQNPPLMRVLTVAQLDLGCTQKRLGDCRRCAALSLAHQPGQVGDDRRVVGGGVAIDLEREAAAGLKTHSGRLQLGKNSRVVRGIHDNRHPGVVLGRGAKQARPTDVDLLDRLLQGDSCARHGLAKGIEVDHHQIDPGNFEFGELSLMLVGGGREDPGKDLRVECLDPSVENLRETGEVADLDHLAPRRRQRLGGSSRRHDLPPELLQGGAQPVEAGLVRNRNQRPFRHGASHEVAIVHGPFERFNVQRSNVLTIAQGLLRYTP